MGSIKRHRNAMIALLAEYNDQPNVIDRTAETDEYAFEQKPRDDAQYSWKGMCPSVIRYARPQKARSASGEWKYIVNTGEHTQTLRLEKCSKPQDSCSYLSHTYRSHCTQVYNYHRLLSWDNVRGLHVDIFKVPTCCSCQVDGYHQKYPPFGGIENFTPSVSYHGNKYHEELDYNDDSDNDDDAFGFEHHHKHDNTFDVNELLLNNKKIRSNVPNPIVNSYHSSPIRNDYQQKFPYDHNHHNKAVNLGTITTTKNLLKEFGRRTPEKSFNDLRVDLDYSPSEHQTEREVNIFGPSIERHDDRFHQKRINIYSVPHIAIVDSWRPDFKHNSGSEYNSVVSTSPTSRSGSLHNKFTAVEHESKTISKANQYRNDAHAHEELSIAMEPTSVLVTGSSRFPSSSRNDYKQTNVAASLPPYYYTSKSANVRLHDGQNGKYKPRYRYANPNVARKTNNDIESKSVSYTKTTTKPTVKSTRKSTTVFEATETVASITNNTIKNLASTYRPIFYAINPNLFKNHQNKFNISSIHRISTTTTPMIMMGSIPKRINYNYHPIIDYFDYNHHLKAQQTFDNSIHVADNNSNTIVILNNNLGYDNNNDKDRILNNVNRVNDESYLHIINTDKINRKKIPSTNSSFVSFAHLPQTDDTHSWHPVII